MVILLNIFIDFRKERLKEKEERRALWEAKHGKAPGKDDDNDEETEDTPVGLTC